MRWVRWSALLFLAIVLLAGAAVHLRTQVRHEGALELDPISTIANPPHAG